MSPVIICWALACYFFFKYTSKYLPTNRSRVIFHRRYFNAKAPVKSTGDAVGWDIFPLKAESIDPHRTVVVNTGCAVIPPPNTYVRIDSRSSQALKGLHVVTHIVDPDYRGTLKVFIKNATNERITLSPDEAIAQFWLPEFKRGDLIEVDYISKDSPRKDRYDI
jgi:dUTPase